MARISKLRNLTLFGKIIAAASRSIKKNAEPQGKWPIGILSRKSVGGIVMVPDGLLRLVGVKPAN